MQTQELCSHYSEKDILPGPAKLPPVLTVVFFFFLSYLGNRDYDDSLALFICPPSCKGLWCPFSFNHGPLSAGAASPSARPSSSHHPWCGYWSHTHTHTHTQSFTFLLIPSCPFLVAQMVKSPPTMQETQETQVQSLGVEDPLEKEMAIISSILAWEIPWTE